MQPRVARRVDERIRERGLDLGCERIALAHGIVHALEHRERSHMAQRFDDFRAGEGTEAGDVNHAHFDACFTAQIFARDRGRLGHGAHAHDRVFRILHHLGLHEIVTPAGELVVFIHGRLENGLDAVVEIALGDLALHVAILILHHARHDGMRRVHEVAQLLPRVSHKAFHQLRFGKAHIFDGVRGEEAVLHVEEGRFAVFGRSAGDERQIGRALRVAREKHAPACVGHAHHIVMARVHVQALAGERPRADVKDRGQTLAGDDVQHLFHQDQTLSRGEIADATAGQREAFGRGGR